LYDNKISLGKNDKGIMIYHSFGNEYIGRWYIVRSNKNNFKWNNKKRELIYISPEWEDTLPDGKCKIKKNVKIKINFTEEGWKKLISYYDDK